MIVIQSILNNFIHALPNVLHYSFLWVNNLDKTIT